MPVGRVGELTALTTGATTRLVDRLEQAGFVRRLPDPADRRRVIVEAAADRATAVQQAFDPVDAAATLALGALDDAALEGVHAYLAACVAAFRAAPVADESSGRRTGAAASAWRADRLGESRPARLCHRLPERHDSGARGTWAQSSTAPGSRVPSRPPASATG